MNILTKNAEKIILSTLKLKSQDEIIDLEYKDLNKDNDIDKDDAVKYSKSYRGSIRLGRGLFYTFKEYHNRAELLIKQQLP